MIPQFPVFRKVTVLPEMLQLPFCTRLNATGRPEVATALTVRVAPTVCAGIALKVMVCAFGVGAVTVSVKAVVWVNEPEVPVTVMG